MHFLFLLGENNYIIEFMILDSNRQMFIFSDFATATRNYAKRQSIWYRKDALFLFLKIYRDMKFENPYEAVATELLHWYSLGKEEFEAVLSEQLRVADCASNLMTKRKIYTE